MEMTLCIVKPEAVRKNLAGPILARVADEGFRIAALKMKHLTRREAQTFYDVHSKRRFYGVLTEYMSEGPVVVAVLARDGAIAHWRKVMGATDPTKADAGTIRKQWGESLTRNATHGSDAPETAAREIAFFFPTSEIF